MNIDFDFVAACEFGLSRVCELVPPSFSETVSIRISEEEHYKSLKPVEKWTDPHLPEGQDWGPEPERSQDGRTCERGLFKFFGLYSPTTEKITIYSRSIWNYARFYGLEPDLVARVVLIHEIAHYITHRGSWDGIEWKRFASASCTDIEGTAQVATWFYLSARGYSAALHLFHDLSKMSPPEYQGWHQWKLGNPKRDPENCDCFASKLRDVSGRTYERGGMFDSTQTTE